MHDCLFLLNCILELLKQYRSIYLAGGKYKKETQLSPFHHGTSENIGRTEAVTAPCRKGNL